ncbi:MAG: succinate dehydrogenase assembly factor 2 [Alphaproteobacteria bacterium]|nr:succinate dehydrogenase assembly factor 2 [Alphaproteobacteria bacterium]
MDDQTRRQRLRFRSWRRGTHEMDLLMGGFADAFVPGFTRAQMDQYEAILRLEDLELFSWVTGGEKVPLSLDSEVMRLLLAHHLGRKK